MTIAELMPFSVLVPLIAALPCALLPGRVAPWLLSLVAAITSAVIAALTLSAAMDETLRYAFGNWQPPIGIEYRVDAANAFVALLVSGLAALTLPWAKASVDREVPERQGTFYALFLLAFAGLMGITLTGDAFNVFVFLEISSLATYALIAHGPDRRALLAAFRYLIMGTVGATFLLIGIGFLYVMTGTLNMADLAERLPEVQDTSMVRAALAFIVVGLGLKLALLPLHLWLPNAYAYAPNFVTVFLAGTATKVALYVMLRFIFTVFSPEYSFAVLPLSSVLMALAIAGMFAGSWVAMFEANLKRMLAYSSVAQVGYMVLGVSLVSLAGLSAAFLHLFNHALIKAALFMAVGSVMVRVGSPRIEAFCRRRPADALDHGRLCAGGAVYYRCADHGRLHQQVVPDTRSDGSRTLVAGDADRDQLADGGLLHMARCRGGLVPRAPGRRGRNPGSAAEPAAAYLVPGCAQLLLRSRHAPAGYRGNRGG